MVAAVRANALQYGLHEMSIAATVLDAVRAESLRQGGARITRAGLRIGELSGVEIESLRFCLDVLVTDTELEPLSFELEAVPWTRRCRDCGAVFRVVDAQTACTACASTSTDSAGGDQLELSFVELEDS
jgi:hydrogenase nickel incorporation protein HypA/HybF